MSIFCLKPSVEATTYCPTIINARDFIAECHECGGTYIKHEFEEVDLILEGKKIPPDNLLCGHWPLLLLSERVVDSWLASGFVGFDVYPVRLFKSNKGELELSDYKYFNVKVKGHCELDFAQMNVKILKECRTCGNATYNKDTWEFGETKIKQHTWDNSHIFVAKGFEFAPLCKDDVLENVYINKFSNFRFTRLNDMFSLSSVDIDLHLKFK